MLFWPITRQRYMAPFFPFFGLRWSEGLFSLVHLITLANELIFMAIVLPPVLYLTREDKNPLAPL